MTSAQFTRMALSLPQATAGAHMGHPDFRVGGKIFATLFTRDDEEFGMVKLSPEQQGLLVRNSSAIFQPIPGGWGRRGCTQVCLAAVRKNAHRLVQEAVFTAWCNTAPKKLKDEMGSSGPSKCRA